MERPFSDLRLDDDAPRSAERGGVQGFHPPHPVEPEMVRVGYA